MKDNLYTYSNDVRAELHERLEEITNNEPHDVISEIADTNVPIYNHDLLQLAADNMNLALVEPELGPAFDGSPTPINIIAANVYEYLTTELWDEWETIQEELEEAE